MKSGSQQEVTSVLRYEEFDADNAPTGRGATLVGVEFQPLGYTDLIGKKLREKVVISLRWNNARVLESSIPDFKIDEIASGNSILESDFSVQTIGLVKGGWLPSGLAHRDNMVVFPDRCTISELAGRFRAGAKTKSDDKDFLDLFEGKCVRISPLLYALEGTQRERPSQQHVEEQWEEACRKIKAALPLARISPEGDGGKQGVIGLLADVHESMARKEQFLMQVVTSLGAPVSKNRRAHVWNHVLASAREFNVPKHSLVVLAALSAVCVGTGMSPARRLLKPSPHYSHQDAYNALADLRSLEMLINLFSMFPDERIMLCTGDKNLALFWAGISASDFSWSGTHASYRLSPVDTLLPEIHPELLKAYLSR